MAHETAIKCIDALWKLHKAASEEHGPRDFEPECPICIAVREVDQLVPETSKDSG